MHEPLQGRSNHASRDSPGCVGGGSAVSRLERCPGTGLARWRGPHRDARVEGFQTPKAWPKELTKKWHVTVGDGVATPALVGNHLYVFSRQGNQEIIRCLKADTGKEVLGREVPGRFLPGAGPELSGPAARPPLPRVRSSRWGCMAPSPVSRPTRASCCGAKEDFKDSVPRFHTSSSPILLDQVCIAQLGGARAGALVAFDLATGKEKWKWTGDGTAYASPAVVTLGETRAIVAETSGNIVAVRAADGKDLWKTAYATRYNASSPMIEGDKIIYAGSGKGTRAVQLQKSDGEWKAKDLWSNPTSSVIYNTPVIKGGLLYGVSENNRLFCLSMQDGKKAWETSLGAGGRGRSGYGSVVDVGSALMVLTPGGDLVVFKPGDKAFEQMAKYPVGKSTYAYPVASGNRIFIKDANSVTLWTVGE